MVTVPKGEKRVHEALVLGNSLKCILVTAEEPGASACSLTIGVGSLSDPADCMGLAHFIEHMCFMGTEKYPGENSFSQFITQHGGDTNAHTELASTTYMFEVDSEVLQEALDRFASCFTCPLMAPDAVNRELLSIESEFNLNSQNDEVRGEQVLMSSLGTHLLNRFAWGNSQSLRCEGLRERSVDTLHKLYSADLMTLSVYATGGTMRELKEWVRASFGGVKNLHCGDLYGDLGLPVPAHSLCCVVPIKEKTVLEVNWFIPPLWEYYDSRPDCYILGLLGHEGRGGILDTLKQGGLSTALMAQHSLEHTNSWFSLSLSIELTQKGFIQLSDVLSTVFSYIKMMKSTVIDMEYYSSLKRINDLKFNYFESLEPSEYCAKISGSLQHFSTEKVLTAGVYDLIETLKPRDVQWALSFLSLQSASLIVKSPSYSTQATLQEKWFGTAYCLLDFPEEITEDVVGLSYPQPNEFIPTTFRELLEVTEPTKVYNSKLVESWHSIDGSFTGSRASAFLALMIPGYRNTIERNVAADLIAEILTNDITYEFGYAASEAGYELSIHSLDNCIEISISGFSDKITVVIERVIAHLYNYKPPENSIQLSIEKLALKYRNAEVEPRNCSRNCRLLFLQHKQYHSSQKLTTLLALAQGNFEFSLGKLKLLLFLMGNVLGSAVTEVSEYLEGLLHAAEVKRLKSLPPRSVTLIPRGVTEWRLNTASPNSVLELYFQFGQASIEERARTALLEQILSEDGFEELRNKQQLGYDVSFSCRITRGIAGLLVKLSSADHSPDVLAERTFKFVAGAISEIPDFQTHVKSVISAKKEPFCNLTEKAEHYWDEILQGYSEFHRRQEEVKYLKQVTEDAFKEWLTEHEFPGKSLQIKVVAAKWGEVEDLFTHRILQDTAAFHNQFACYSWLRIMH